MTLFEIQQFLKERNLSFHAGYSHSAQKWYATVFTKRPHATTPLVKSEGGSLEEVIETAIFSARTHFASQETQKLRIVRVSAE